MDDAAMAAVALDDGGWICILALGALMLILALGALMLIALTTLVAGVAVVSGKVNKLGSSIE